MTNLAEDTKLTEYERESPSITRAAIAGTSIGIYILGFQPSILDYSQIRLKLG